jgi:CheY-like chemotaxis protein
MKVFLVDDDEDIRLLMTRMLKKAGVGAVETAASGEEALEKLLSGELPDVLILDQNMPGMRGDQLMARVRDRYSDLPILFSSGQPDIESWAILNQPKVALISKPFTMDEIQAKLAQFAHEIIPKG